jgi:hypothetical protein
MVCSVVSGDVGTAAVIEESWNASGNSECWQPIAE